MVIFIAVTFRKYLFAIAKRFVPRSLVHLEIFQWKSAPFTNQLSSAILSLLYQCLICVSLSLLARSVGIHVKLIEFFWISSVTILFTAIPISYAGIGIREITLSYCLGLLGVAQTQILAFAAIFYGFMLVPTSLGLILTLQDFIKKRIRKE